MEIDYKTLLLKYIGHVSDNEGTAFISHCGSSEFTEDEWDELIRLEKISDERY
jgi:hypothetical protein